MPYIVFFLTSELRTLDLKLAIPLGPLGLHS